MLELFETLGFVPKNCTWELTLGCNLRCQHCGSRAGQRRPDELNTEEALTLCGDLAALGCEHVTLAGGEPTLRQDWPQLVERLRQGSVLVSLLSNGMTWSPHLLQTALAVGLSQVAFSLDGLEHTHDQMRQIAGSFRQVLRAIDQSQAASLPVSVVTFLTRRNVADLEEMHALLRAHGILHWQVQQGLHLGNLTEHSEIILDAAAMRDLVSRLAALIATGLPPKIHVANNIGYYGPYEETLRQSKARLPFWVGCRAGLTNLGIESHGAIKGCLSLPSELNGRTDFIEGNLRQRSLTDIWNDPNAFAYTRRFRVEYLRGACRDCDFGEICRGGCTAMSVGYRGIAHDFPNCYYALTRT